MKRMVFICLLFILSSTLSGYCGTEEISSVKLASLSADDTSGVSHLRFTVRGRKAGMFEPVFDPKESIEKSLEYFFIGLTIPERAFWVDLRPDKSDMAVDPKLKNTDLGRVMLNADLRLKEDVSNALNPQASKAGREFWTRLYNKADELGMNKIPVLTRVWIVPDDALVTKTKDGICILNSKLSVKLESVYSLQKNAVKDDKEAELLDCASDLMRELILPELTRRVNEDFTYSGVREVYNALILAQWYKQEFSYANDPLLRAADYGILQDTRIDYSYNPDEIYSEYVKSWEHGEYSFSETGPFAGPFSVAVTTRSYFSGGIDFRGIRIEKADKEVQPDKDAVLFSCDLFIPRGTERPLEYARNQLEVNTGEEAQNINLAFSLTKNLPDIKSEKSASTDIDSIGFINRIERVLLSKL